MMFIFTGKPHCEFYFEESQTFLHVFRIKDGLSMTDTKTVTDVSAHALNFIEIKKIQWKWQYTFWKDIIHVWSNKKEANLDKLSSQNKIDQKFWKLSYVKATIEEPPSAVRGININKNKSGVKAKYIFKFNLSKQTTKKNTNTK